ncbi:MAG: MBL fold metallo-hydrolase [Deltaproteobacteria bacterium]|nr:MBL fold metallo-hydrolase [Deltaproteobacteria bacterium]
MGRGAAALLVLGLVLGAGCPKKIGPRYTHLPQVRDGALRIIAFDVGQADATLVLYGGKSLLIDCGSPLKQPLAASQRIPPRLDELLPARHLDYLLITHYHQDHFGAPGRRKNAHEPSGVFSLIERDGLTIDTVVDRGFYSVTAKGASQLSYERSVQEWIASGVVGKRREVRAGDRLELGPGLDVRIVAAAANGYLDRMKALVPTWVEENPPSENDYSIAAKLVLGDFEMLVAGDLSGYNVLRQFGPKRSSYNDIESQIAGDVGAVEVYRANHHGSENSSNPCFTEVLHPLVTVFSSGDNRYGHPAVEVVKRLKSYGAVYITGGADPSVYSEVAAWIVGDDIDIIVAKDGRQFWVNGAAHQSQSDAEEAARPGARATCRAPDPADLKPEAFPKRDDSAND